MIDRRNLLTMAAAAPLMSASGAVAQERSLSTDEAPANTQASNAVAVIAFNQVGYVAGREAIIVCNIDGVVTILNERHDQIGRDEAELAESDFGRWAKIRYSPPESGRYRFGVAKVGTRDVAFDAAATPAYRDLYAKVFGLFGLQRCGHSDRGWLGRPCHADDGIRSDNEAWQDFSGGWHDASDRRKYVGNCSLSVCSLTSLKPNGVIGQEALDEEIRWGADWLMKMQDPEGFVFAFSCIWPDHESDKITDNRARTGDERKVQVDRNSLAVHMQYVAALARTSMHFKGRDDAYAARCAEAASRCHRYARTNYEAMLAELPDGDPQARIVSKESDMVATPLRALGTSILGAVSMARMTGDASHRAEALGYLRRMKALQTPRNANGHGGFFFADASRTKTQPTKGCDAIAYIGVVDLIELVGPRDGAEAVEMLQSLVEGWLLPVSKRNAFDVIPYVGTLQDGGRADRSLDGLGYRYFKGPPDFTFFSGRSPGMLGLSVMMARAAKLLDKPEWKALAWRQLDWVLGANPFNMTMVHGIGYNQAPLFVGSSRVPFLPGGALNGIRGDIDDQPIAPTGLFEDCEYWMPANAHLLWLLPHLLDDEVLA